MPLLKQDREQSSELRSSPAATSKVLAPSPNELEVSVFGPGYGESILVHLGEGKWLAIDSCIDRESGQPKAISYLRSMGVDPASAIAMVVASHWHDDHVRGLSALFREAPAATFVCSPALTEKEFLALADLYAKTESALQNGPKEIQACLDEVIKRKNAGQARPLRHAVPDRTLLELRNPHHSGPTRLLSLSPSDEMVSRTLTYAAQILSALERGAREDSLVPGAPNDTAIALRLDIAGRSILLGSDLEETNNPSVGWSAVLQGLATAHLPAQTFKVAHHGSYTGHHPDVWTTMLSPNPLSLLTPFRLGRHQLPTEDDRRRILALTEKAYISADPHAKSKPATEIPRKAAVLVNRTASNRRLAIPSVGHIRWRAPLSDPAHPGIVSLFDGAMLLADVSPAHARR